MANDKDVKSVDVPVEGTVVDWAHGVQVNHVTGQKFDFQGKLLDPAGQVKAADKLTITGLSPDHGKSGDPDTDVQITGTGFTGSTVVKFGETAVKVLGPGSSTHLTVRVPTKLLKEVSGIVMVHAENPAPHPESSTSVTFEVRKA